MTESPAPVVGIVMGSDSDWPVMREAARALEEFGIPYEADVVSAHRMPDEMIAYGQNAAERGLRVVIAGAGGAAHLPGMLASVTPLPVVGVPVPLTYLDGMDSLLSIVQMPAGVPVATVSIGGARNAGLLAARIVGTGTDEPRRRRARADGHLPGGPARPGARQGGVAARAGRPRPHGLSRRPTPRRLRTGLPAYARRQSGCARKPRTAAVNTPGWWAWTRCPASMRTRRPSATVPAISVTCSAGIGLLGPPHTTSVGAVIPATTCGQCGSGSSIWARTWSTASQS